MPATTNNLQAVFNLQKANQIKVGKTTYKQRIKKLNTLKKAIEHTYREAILEALKTDLGKPKVEAEMTEIYQIVGDIKYVKHHLKSWMKKQHVDTPLSMLGASSYYIHESKGVCLIISPWNFPFNLTFGPLVSAIAAGNTAIIKPSEMTPNCSALMKKIIETVFESNEVALFEGGVETSTALLTLPFNHIFFTGSPAVGKIVMTAAAKHLASVTLELGGKSPTIIDETANIKTAAKKIVWGKFMNCGQICVSPDYALVHHSKKEAFIEACKHWITHYFGNQPDKSEAYGRIVTPKHYERLMNYLEDVKQQPEKLITGGSGNATTKYISPTLIKNLSDDVKLLNEEIFGPILPIKTYENLNEAIDYINSKERPLALYIYSKNKNNIKTIIKNTRSGGACINNNIIHYANHNLPFGGINNSGIGKSHGKFGYEAFSNKRAVVKQHTFGITELLFPPYNSFKEKLAKLTIRWF